MAVIAYAGKARSLTVAWGTGRDRGATSAQADIPATVVAMSPRPDGKLDTHERAQRANAALTTEQRSAAGKARAAQLHSLLSLVDRACKKWPEATPEEKKAARAKLRAAGVIA